MATTILIPAFQLVVPFLKNDYHKKTNRYMNRENLYRFKKNLEVTEGLLISLKNTIYICNLYDYFY